MGDAWYSLTIFAFATWVGLASVLAWSETHVGWPAMAIIIAYRLSPLLARRVPGSGPRASRECLQTAGSGRPILPTTPDHLH